MENQNLKVVYPTVVCVHCQRELPPHRAIPLCSQCHAPLHPNTCGVEISAGPIGMHICNNCLQHDDRALRDVLRDFFEKVH